jgi:hypothetical protein
MLVESKDVVKENLLRNQLHAQTEKLKSWRMRLCFFEFWLV